MLHRFRRLQGRVSSRLRRGGRELGGVVVGGSPEIFDGSTAINVGKGLVAEANRAIVRRRVEDQQNLDNQ